MSEFRTGNKAKSHPYPATPHIAGAAGGGPFARNSAVSFPVDTTVPGAPGLKIPWALIEVGAAGINVPITPKTTGILRITAAITMKNTGVTAANITVNLQLDGVTQAVPVDEEVSVPAAGAAQQYVTIPLMVSGLTVTKALHNIGILLTSSDGTASVFLVSATIDVQEVVTPTG